MATEQDRDTPAKAAPAKAAPQRPAAQSDKPNENLGEQLTAAHEARVSVPGAPNVDARLDNRTGADRPPVEKWPAVPQQVDGPDVMHQAEHTRRTLQARDEAVGERKGMFSPGPHGLSDESLREAGASGSGAAKSGGDGPLYGTESVTEDELAGNPTAG